MKTSVGDSIELYGRYEIDYIKQIDVILPQVTVRMEVLSSNQPNLIFLILSLILFEILFPLFAAADYLNMTVSNKKALAILDTVHK